MCFFFNLCDVSMSAQKLILWKEWEKISDKTEIKIQPTSFAILKLSRKHYFVLFISNFLVCVSENHLDFDLFKSIYVNLWIILFYHYFFLVQDLFFVRCIFLCFERGYRLHVINKTNTLECCQHNNRFNHSISIYFSYIIFRFRRHSVLMSFLRVSIKKKHFHSCYWYL